jgi:hypothetical protein
LSGSTLIASTRRDDVWMNEDVSRFAVVPDVGSFDLSATARSVEMLVADYRRGKLARDQSRDSNKSKGVEMLEPLAELYDLHAQGRVLWPTGVQWGSSVLGNVSANLFVNLICESDQHCAEVRDEVERSALVQRWGTVSRPASTWAYAIWRLFMTARLSTIGLENLRDFDEAHLKNILIPMRDGDAWADWIRSHHRKDYGRFVRFMADYLHRPLFGKTMIAKVVRKKENDLRDWAHLSWLSDAIELWAQTQSRMSDSAASMVTRLLIPFAKTLPPEKCRIDRFFSGENKPALLQFASEFSTPRVRALAIGRVFEFAEWLVRDHGPFVKDGIDLSLSRYEVDQFLKRTPTTRVRPAEVTARPMPARFHHMLKTIIAEENFRWPRSLKNRATGEPLHWFEWTDPVTGISRPAFCEVLPRMLLLHLELPLRNIQIRRLDSGEGDDRIYCQETGTWSASSAPHAGYWRRLGAKNPRRGVFREIAGLSGTITGFWINSNKTQDVRNLFDESCGYEIPWQHDEVLDNLMSMRRWQERYNPVASALAYDDVPATIFTEKPSSIVRRMLPARFYLFRYPQNKGLRGKEAPPSYDAFSQFFHDALDELERRLREEQPQDAIRIITERAADGRPTKAIFSIHGMRASTLTTLHLAGVPIEVLSKALAGHATILMTLQYTKFDPAHVNDVLNDARTKALSAGRTQFANMLRSATIEQAMRMSARLSDEGLLQAKGLYEEPTAWVRTDIGICPNGGTMCGVGGPLVQGRQANHAGVKSLHAPVPGHGRNCVRCRFFVTGLPFLPALWMHAMAILAKVDSLSTRIAQTQEEVSELKGSRRRTATGGVDADRIKMLDETWIADAEIRDQALADLHATIVMVEKIRVIGNCGETGSDAKLPMLLDGESMPGLTGRDSTRFELVDWIVQGSRLFPSINSAELERERDAFLDKILFSGGYTPITLAPLSDEERRRAADALAQIVLMELGAVEAQHLIDGQKTLADVGLQDRLEKAVAAAIGRPIERLPIPSPPIMIEAGGAFA